LFSVELQFAIAGLRLAHGTGTQGRSGGQNPLAKSTLEARCGPILSWAPLFFQAPDFFRDFGAPVVTGV
jgi:hypothetical protein